MIHVIELRPTCSSRSAPDVPYCTTDDRRPTTDDRRPTTDDRRLATGVFPD
jgi:hypothetical protein